MAADIVITGTDQSTEVVENVDRIQFDHANGWIEFHRVAGGVAEVVDVVGIAQVGEIELDPTIPIG